MKPHFPRARLSCIVFFLMIYNGWYDGDAVLICLCSVPGSMKLHNLINKLKKWIKILEAKTKLLPK